MHYVLAELEEEGESMVCKEYACKEWFSSAAAWIQSLARATEKVNSCRDWGCDQRFGEQGH